MIYITLEERHCFGHNEIDVTFNREHRDKTYNAITKTSQQRLQKLLPRFYVEFDDGIELWQIWEKK